MFKSSLNFSTLYISQAHIISPSFYSVVSPKEASVLLGSLASLRCRPDLLVDIIQVLTTSLLCDKPGHVLTGRILSRAVGALTVLNSQLMSMESRDEALDRLRQHLDIFLPELVPKVYEITISLQTKNQDTVILKVPVSAASDAMDLFLWLQV